MLANSAIEETRMGDCRPLDILRMKDWVQWKKALFLVRKLRCVTMLYHVITVYALF